MKSLNSSNNKGFTIIELLIAVVIIGALTAIAATYYLQYRVKTNNMLVYETYKGVIKNAFASGFCDAPTGTTILLFNNNALNGAVSDVIAAVKKIGGEDQKPTFDLLTNAALCKTNAPDTIIAVPAGGNAEDYPAYDITVLAGGQYQCNGAQKVGQPGGAPASGTAANC